ncbi:hypothetical protein TNCV_1694391 [Trichonephila clavipes]|nr:hypothetical protein TNCV_1694391 [Trichonephila clavipes]
MFARNVKPMELRERTGKSVNDGFEWMCRNQSSVKEENHYVSRVVVPCRTKECLLAVIKEWVLPGTTIISDCWASYNCLKDEGFQHLKQDVPPEHEIIQQDASRGHPLHKRRYLHQEERVFCVTGDDSLHLQSLANFSPISALAFNTMPIIHFRKSLDVDPNSWPEQLIHTSSSFLVFQMENCP